MPPTNDLHLFMMSNTYTRGITDPSGTIVGQYYRKIHVILFVQEGLFFLFFYFRSLQPLPSSCLGVTGSNFRSLAKILDCSHHAMSGPFARPVWRDNLSIPLAIFGLVSRHLTNYLTSESPTHESARLFRHLAFVIPVFFRLLDSHAPFDSIPHHDTKYSTNRFLDTIRAF